MSPSHPPMPTTGPLNLHPLPREDETFLGGSSKSMASFGAEPRPSPVYLG